jgi:hypothetical protein
MFSLNSDSQYLLTSWTKPKGRCRFRGLTSLGEEEAWVVLSIMGLLMAGTLCLDLMVVNINLKIRIKEFQWVDP